MKFAFGQCLRNIDRGVIGSQNKIDHAGMLPTKAADLVELAEVTSCLLDGNFVDEE